jgi:hypothetical protein
MCQSAPPVDQEKNGFSSGEPVLICPQMRTNDDNSNPDKKGYLPFFAGSKRRVRRSGNGLAPGSSLISTYTK